MDPDETLTILGTQYSPEILGATAEPRSVRELSDSLEIPIATCYRRVEELDEAGLLEFKGRELSDERRRTNVYRRTVDELNVTFLDNEYDVTVSEAPEVRNRLDDAWRTLTWHDR